MTIAIMIITHAIFKISLKKTQKKDLVGKYI
jgi:hypothetical protein